MGRIKPKTQSELMVIANKFADGEDAYHNKRTRSPKDDRGNMYGNQRRISRNYDNYGSHSQVAVHKQLQFDLQATNIDRRSQSLHAEA
jgi:hypothetical protein